MNMKRYHKIQGPFKRGDDHELIPYDWTEDEFEYLAPCQWNWTEKVHGTNVRVIYDGTDVLYCGRSDRALLHGDLVNRLMELLPTVKIAAKFNNPVTFYGEGYGAGIHKGGNYSGIKDFVLFDVKVGDYWLRREDKENVAQAMGIDIVPLVNTGTLYEAMDYVTEGMTSNWGDFQAEGLVCTPAFDLFTRGGKRIITKIKSTDFFERTHKYNQS